MAKFQMDANEKKQPITADDFFEYAKSIFDCAEEYFHLTFNELPHLVDITIALTTNMAFACELYLKCILTLENQKLTRGHSICDLFNSIHDEKKNRIKTNINQNDFDLSLKEIGKAFETARYVYEYKEMVINVKFITLLMNELRNECFKLFDEYQK